MMGAKFVACIINWNIFMAIISTNKLDPKITKLVIPEQSIFELKPESESMEDGFDK